MHRPAPEHRTTVRAPTHARTPASDADAALHPTAEASAGRGVHPELPEAACDEQAGFRGTTEVSAGRGERRSPASGHDRWGEHERTAGSADADEAWAGRDQRQGADRAGGARGQRQGSDRTWAGPGQRQGGDRAWGGPGQRRGGDRVWGARGGGGPVARVRVGSNGAGGGARLERPVAGRWGSGRGGRLRARLRYRLWRRRVMAVVLAGAAALGAQGGAVDELTGQLPGFASSATQGRAAGGSGAGDQMAGVPVAVAARDLTAGEIVGEDDVEWRAIARDAASGSAASKPVGRTVAASIHAGEVVTDRRLGPGGRLGLAADEVAIALPLPHAPPTVATGDVVSLVAVIADDARGAVAHPLDPARVVAIDDRAVTVAVPETSAPRLFELLAVGTIEMAVTPWRS